tara:strand:- start:678 stop:998 length:321 start_codon:yes stop_codon:yes gene_type:complete
MDVQRKTRLIQELTKEAGLGALAAVLAKAGIKGGAVLAKGGTLASAGGLAGIGVGAGALALGARALIKRRKLRLLQKAIAERKAASAGSSLKSRLKEMVNRRINGE